MQPTDNPYVAYVPTRPQDIAPGLDNPRIAPDIIPLPDDAGDAPGKSPQLDELSPEKRRAITDRIRVLEKALANGSIDFSGLKYKTGYGAGRLLTALDYKSNWPGSMKIGEGEAEVTAFPYKLVRSVCSPSEYYYYLKDTVTSIDDIITLIDKRFLSYVAQDSYGRDPVTAIASGFADCDEFSEIFRDILTYLGEKEGKDYKARVVGQYVKGKKAGHAVAVFEDGGKRFAVDQAKPHEFTQNHEASHLFSAPARGRIITWDESKTDKNRNSLRWTLDDKWEPRKGGTLSFVSYDGEIDFENPGSSNFVASLPGNWKQYKTAAITMRKTGNRVIYKNGELRAFELKTGPIRQIEYQKEDTVLKIYRSGNLEFEHYKAGKLVGKKYRSGPISYEFIKDDKVHERTFRSGEYQRVWYEQNGKVKMYMDFRGNRSFAKH